MSRYAHSKQNKWKLVDYTTALVMFLLVAVAVGVVVYVLLFTAEHLR